MSRTVYLNGAFIAPEQAQVSIFDRAVLFGDAVYEVAGVLDGKLIDFENHMRRLARSLAELSIPQPVDREEILAAYRHLIKANRVNEGLVYLQISRGVAERDFIYSDGLTPTVIMFTQIKQGSENDYANTGVSLKSVADIRWARRDIKSVNLLGQVMAKQAAYDAGAYEALMIGADGFVTECGAMSFFMIKHDAIITRALSNDILPGVTRQTLVMLCAEYDINLQQRTVTLQEVYDADEVFITGSSSYVMPVTSVDGRKIANATPGEMTKRLQKIYIEHIRATLI